MHKRLCIGLFISWMALRAAAQTPFTASWDFENNAGGSSSNPNVSVSSLSPTGVTIAGYPAGQTGDAISLQFWPTGALNTNEYVEVSVTPQNYRYSLSSISFSFNRSTDGPTQLAVRYSQDNFSNNLGTASVGSSFSSLNVPLFINDSENTIMFRIYGFAATTSPGTLRLDNLRINGTVAVVPLPVELTYFQGKTFDNQIELNWETAWERNAARFEVQRSNDLQEFVTLGILNARGDTRERSRYSFTDIAPLPGANYYRLRQTDNDGKWEVSKIIVVHFNTDTPQIWLYGNPTSGQQIKVRLQNITLSELKLYNSIGQSVPFTWQSFANGDYLLQTNAPPGWYWLVGQYQNRKVSQRVLLVEP
jgi:hypothetical protein